MRGVLARAILHSSGVGLGTTGTRGMLRPPSGALLRDAESAIITFTPMRLTEPRVFSRRLTLQLPKVLARTGQAVAGLTVRKNRRRFPRIGIDLPDNRWWPEGMSDAGRLCGERKTPSILRPRP